MWAFAHSNRVSMPSQSHSSIITPPWKWGDPPFRPTSISATLNCRSVT